MRGTSVPTDFNPATTATTDWTLGEAADFPLDHYADLVGARQSGCDLDHGWHGERAERKSLTSPTGWSFRTAATVSGDELADIVWVASIGYAGIDTSEWSLVGTGNFD